MLSISIRQEEVLSQNVREEFIRRACKYLRNEFSTYLCMHDEEQLIQRVVSWTANAEHYQLERECDVIQFLEICAAVGCDISSDERHIRARHILADFTLTAEERLSLLYDYVAMVTNEHE